MGEMCPKLSHFPPLIKKKILSTPPLHNDNIKANPPPPTSLEKSLPSIPSYLEYYWSSSSGTNITWNDSSTYLEESLEESSESLDSESAEEASESLVCVVFAWIGRFFIFYSISGTKGPACVGENSINQFSLAPTYLKTFLLRYVFSCLLVRAFTSFSIAQEIRGRVFLSLTLYLDFPSRNSRCCT